MNRRNFITLLGGLVAWPYRAEAQGTQKVWRIGHIFPASPTVVSHFADAFERHMLNLGYSPGRNLIVTRRFPEPGHVEDAVRELLPETDIWRYMATRRASAVGDAGGYLTSRGPDDVPA